MDNMNVDMSSYADLMLNMIQQIITQTSQKSTIVDSAIIRSMNSDGTANLYFPPDDGSTFTRISNQTPFSLSAGDSVEVLIKNGSYSNCWIIAKHGATYKEPVTTTEDIENEEEEEEEEETNTSE